MTFREFAADSEHSVTSSPYLIGLGPKRQSRVDLEEIPSTQRDALSGPSDDSMKSNFMDEARRLLQDYAVEADSCNQQAAKTQCTDSEVQRPVQQGACYLRCTGKASQQGTLLNQFECVLRRSLIHNVRISLDRIFVDFETCDDSEERPGYMALASLVAEDNDVSVIYVSNLESLCACQALNSVFCEVAQRFGKTIYSLSHDVVQ